MTLPLFRGDLNPQNSVGSLGFVPNLFAAALILLVGWFVARIVQRSHLKNTCRAR
jgi:hypothetical protein